MKNKGGGAKNDRTNWTKSNSNAKPEWMLAKPNDSNISKSREWKGKKWWWCGKETGGKCDPPQWRAHHPNECRGTMRRRPAEHDLQETKVDESANQQKKMKLSNALSAITEKDGADKTDTDLSGYSSE